MTWFISLIGLPIVTSPLLYIVGHQCHKRLRIVSRWFALVILATLWVVFGLVYHAFSAAESLIYTLGTITLQLDGLSLLMAALILLMGTATVIFSAGDIANELDENKYYAMLLILIGTMLGLVCAGDLFNLWVWFESMAIASYLLVAFYRQRENALAACIKYFIQTVSGSILVLFGIALVLLQTGGLGLATNPVQASPLLVVAGTLFVMGFGVKVALFPNYTWLPDAYAESPTGVTALLSSVVTVSGLVALLKALSLVVWSLSAWGALLMVLGTLNIVVGNVLALPQQEVKRILAYSSISHIGYIVLALGIGMTTQTLPGMQAGLLHLFIHGLMKALAFFAVGGFIFALQALQQQKRTTKQITIDDLRGAGRRYPMMGVALAIAMFSLVGVPLLAGFISKWQILVAGVVSQSGWVIALVIFVAVNSVFSLAYYLPIVNALYNAASAHHWGGGPQIPLAMRLPVFVLSLLLVVFGLWPGSINGLIEPASVTLLALFGG